MLELQHWMRYDADALLLDWRQSMEEGKDVAHLKEAVEKVVAQKDSPDYLQDFQSFWKKKRRQPLKSCHA